MNTDNTAICGETLDFGPCAMLGEYDESKVFSSIDERGRYAFGNQGKIAQWNMARLADCLMPLLIEVSDKKLTEEVQEQQALTKVEALINEFTDEFDTAYFTMYGKKLGLTNIGKDNMSLSDISLNNKSLISDLLTMMQTQKLDYTETFLQLTQSLTDDAKAQELESKLGDWYQAWLAVISQEAPKQESHQQNKYQQAQDLMSKNNPVVIPRNHHIETILEVCETVIANDLSCTKNSTKKVITNTLDEFLKVLRSPYQQIEATAKYQQLPADGDRYYQTYCGT